MLCAHIAVEQFRRWTLKNFVFAYWRCVCLSSAQPQRTTFPLPPLVVLSQRFTKYSQIFPWQKHNNLYFPSMCCKCLRFYDLYGPMSKREEKPNRYLVLINTSRKITPVELHKFVIILFLPRVCCQTTSHFVHRLRLESATSNRPKFPSSKCGCEHSAFPFSFGVFSICFFVCLRLGKNSTQTK